MGARTCPRGAARPPAPPKRLQENGENGNTTYDLFTFQPLVAHKPTYPQVLVESCFRNQFIVPAVQLPANRRYEMDTEALPRIDPAAVDRLTAYLRGRSWSQRPAQATARVLALMVRLWEDEKPFPTRSAVADHVGVSVPTVDLVLRRARQGELKIVYEGAGTPLRGKRWIVPSETIRAIGRAPEATTAAFGKAPYRRRRVVDSGDGHTESVAS